MRRVVCIAFFSVLVATLGCYDSSKAEFSGRLASIGYMRDGMEYGFERLPPRHFLVAFKQGDQVELVCKSDLVESDKIVGEVSADGTCSLLVPFSYFGHGNEFVATYRGKPIRTIRKPRHIPVAKSDDTDEVER